MSQNEADWKKIYILRRVDEKINPTRFLSNQEIKQSISELRSMTEPLMIDAWVKNNMSPIWMGRLSNSIRTKRLRVSRLENEQPNKNVELTFSAWQKLSNTSKDLDISLSDTVIALCDAHNSKNM